MVSRNFLGSDDRQFGQANMRHILPYFLAGCLVVGGEAISESASANDVSLRDLYGYTISAEWTLTFSETSAWHNGAQQVSMKHFSDKIYISTRGRLFHTRTRTINGVTQSPEASVNGGPNDLLSFDPKIGFIDRVIPSDFNLEGTTFVRVTRISINRVSGGFACKVSATLDLKSGQTEYIFFSNWGGRDTEVQIHSYQMHDSSCSVSEGNMLAGG